VIDDRDRGRERVDTSHLDGAEDGCGCAEVWEHLSEGREADEDADGDAASDTDHPDDERDATVADAGRS
jgi:hypothetical protein